MKDTDKTERVQRGAAETLRGMEHLPHEGRLRKPGGRKLQQQRL